MHRFRLKILIEEFVLHQSILSFTEDQYQAMLDIHRKKEDRHSSGVSTEHILESALPEDEPYDDEKDYSGDYPTEVISMIVGKNIHDLLFTGSGWGGHGSFNPLESKRQGTMTVENDETGQFCWELERITE